MTYVRISTLELVGDFTIDETLVERVREEVRAVMNSSPGFLSYDAGYDEEGSIAIVTRYESEELAAGPTVQMRAWVAENLAERVRLARTFGFDSVASVVA